MAFWISVWTIVFIVTLIVFSCLVVVIAIGGWGDIKSMLNSLDRDESSD